MTEIRLLRSVVGYTRWDRRRNLDIRNELDLQPLKDWIEEYKRLCWYVDYVEPNFLFASFSEHMRI